MSHPDSIALVHYASTAQSPAAPSFVFCTRVTECRAVAIAVRDSFRLHLIATDATEPETAANLL